MSRNSLPRQGIFRREAPGIHGQDHAPRCPKSPAFPQGEAQKQGDQQDAFPVGAAVCSDQNSIP